MKTYIPWIANILGGLSIVPQLYVVVNEWYVGPHVSMLFLILGIISNLVWCIYGKLIKDKGLLVLGLIFTFFYGTMIFIKISETKHVDGHEHGHTHTITTPIYT